MSTIAAISTPNAIGGISVIRISGPKSIKIAEKLFKSLNDIIVSSMKGYTCAYGFVHDNGKKVDDVILSLFRAPKSYTGEDVVEISCHGGIFITIQILRIILKNGAELALPGEFTKRAFLNGKLSLTQAEAVMDVISANSDNELKYAIALKDGAIFKRVKKVSESLIKTLGDLAAWADYPEEDIPIVDSENLNNSLNNILSELKKILTTYDYGKIIREGINTAIVGKPNVGKSTLMNCLSGYEKSIVTDIAGTTRDIIEEKVKIGNLILRLYDTAGIRLTDDIIESIGVNNAYKKINDVDLIFVLFDSSKKLCDDDFKIIEQVKNRKTIAIINKIDISNDFNKDILKENFKYIIEISAKDNFGIENLEEILEEMFLNEEIDADQGILANERQKLNLEKSLISLKEAIDILNMGESFDAVTVMLDDSLHYLLQLTGESVTENVVNEVFSRFCVGK